RIRGACGTNGTSWATIFTQPVTFTLGGARLENSSVANLDVYPNPSRGKINILFNSDTESVNEISISNYLGKEVYFKQFNNLSNSNYSTVDLTDKAKGIYLIRIKTDSEVINSKMTIQ
ncbi:MAG: T9SS type A sorting domain-containing protein, partial [Flavobacteriales bacterium]